MLNKTPDDTTSHAVGNLTLAALSVGVIVCTTLYSFFREKTGHISDDAMYGFIAKSPKRLNKK